MAKKQIKKKVVKSVNSKKSTVAKKDKVVKVVKKAKVLSKSTDKKILAGVLAGVADYLNYDPTLVRLLFVLIVIVTGIIPGVLVYLLAAIVMPKKVY